MGRGRERRGEKMRSQERDTGVRRGRESHTKWRSRLEDARGEMRGRETYVYIWKIRERGDGNTFSHRRKVKGRRNMSG